MKKFLTVFLLVFAATFCSAQNNGYFTHLRTRTSAPAACSSGIGGVYWDGSAKKIMVCHADNVWDAILYETNIGVGSNGNLFYNNGGNFAAFGTTISGNNLTLPGSVSTTGTNGGIAEIEGTGANAGAAAGSDALWADSTAHRWKMNNNAAGALMVPGIASAGTAGNCVKLGTNGIDIVDAGAACGTGGGGSSLTPTVAILPYFMPSSSDEGVAVANAANAVEVMEVYIPYTMTLTSMKVDLVTASASQTCDAGLYDSSGTLEFHFTSGFSTTSTGIQTATISYSLTPGMYYEAFTCTDTTAAIKGVGLGTDTMIMYNGGTTIAGHSATSATAGVLPATISTTITADYKQTPVMVLK